MVKLIPLNKTWETVPWCRVLEKMENGSVLPPQTCYLSDGAIGKSADSSSKQRHELLQTQPSVVKNKTFLNFHFWIVLMWFPKGHENISIALNVSTFPRSCGGQQFWVFTRSLSKVWKHNAWCERFFVSLFFRIFQLRCSSDSVKSGIVYLHSELSEEYNFSPQAYRFFHRRRPVSF